MSGRHDGPRWTGSVAVMTAALLAVAACGASGTSTEQTPESTVTTAPPTPAATTPATTRAATTAPKAATIKVPGGVGLDYQAAQDLWRGAGLHVAPAKDATGRNRIPVIDANWIVVAQDPPAGTTVEAGSFITATVKKDSDS